MAISNTRLTCTMGMSGCVASVMHSAQGLWNSRFASMRTDAASSLQAESREASKIGKRLPAGCVPAWKPSWKPGPHALESRHCNAHL